ncbi:hypothetical protein [Actinomadura geliboluensis]|uniref:hypothetical protein n=1 Tax=Actinomadura geliboluensis TaxID=882440 RepID=UPI003676E2F7
MPISAHGTAAEKGSLILGMIFRRPLGRMLSRVQRLSWGEAEAELAEAEQDVQEALHEAARPLPAGDAAQPAHRARIERVVQDAAMWGFRLRESGVEHFPETRISWAGEDRPRLLVIGTPGAGKYTVGVLGEPADHDPGNMKLRDLVDQLVDDGQRSADQGSDTEADDVGAPRPDADASSPRSS